MRRHRLRPCAASQCKCSKTNAPAGKESHIESVPVVATRVCVRLVAVWLLILSRLALESVIVCADLGLPAPSGARLRPPIRALRACEPLILGQKQIRCGPSNAMLVPMIATGPRQSNNSRAHPGPSRHAAAPPRHLAPPGPSQPGRGCGGAAPAQAAVAARHEAMGRGGPLARRARTPRRFLPSGNSSVAAAAAVAAALQPGSMQPRSCGREPPTPRSTCTQSGSGRWTTWSS